MEERYKVLNDLFKLIKVDLDVHMKWA